MTEPIVGRRYRKMRGKHSKGDENATATVLRITPTSVQLAIGGRSAVGRHGKVVTFKRDAFAVMFREDD